MKRTSMLGGYAAKHSAQSYLCAEREVKNVSAACGSACGAGDGGNKVTAACGSACGTGDK
jgi:hypothetical protein